MIHGHAGREALRFLTDFADQAVILPVLATVIGVLFWQGWGRGARSWLLAAAGCLGTVFLLKLGFGVYPVGALRTPSGHAAVAAFVGGGLAALGLSHKKPAVAVAGALVAGMLAALVVGYTRVALDRHTLPESVLGGMVGIVGAGVLALLQGGVPDGVRRYRVGAAVLVVALALHGTHLNMEPFIQHLVLKVAALDRTGPRLL